MRRAPSCGVGSTCIRTGCAIESIAPETCAHAVDVRCDRSCNERSQARSNPTESNPTTELAQAQWLEVGTGYRCRCRFCRRAGPTDPQQRRIRPWELTRCQCGGSRGDFGRYWRGHRLGHRTRSLSIVAIATSNWGRLPGAEERQHEASIALQPLKIETPRCRGTPRGFEPVHAVGHNAELFTSQSTTNRPTDV